MLDLASTIRDIPDFPKKGILFYDITTLLQDPQALDESIRQLAEPYREAEVETVVGVESRGFIFGAAVARELGAGFVPIHHRRPDVRRLCAWTGHAPRVPLDATVRAALNARRAARSLP